MQKTLLWKKSLLLLLASLMLACVSPGYAHGNFNCVFQTINRVDFGTYISLNDAPTDSVGNIAYRCDGTGTHDNVAILLTSGHARNFNRYMRNQGEHLLYNLYLDAGRHIVWGNGTSGTSRYSSGSITTGKLYHIPIYGRILAGQSVPAGRYHDSVLVILNF